MHIFLADAHLRHPDDQNYRKMIAFLRHLQGKASHLYILGDLFRFWTGYRYTVYTPYVPLLNALYDLVASGTRISYIEGNHDFHVGPYFTDILGANVYPDTATISLDGRKLHLCHGDRINPADYGYRALRWLFRNRGTRILKRMVPADTVWGISVWLNRGSDRRHHGERRPFPEKMVTAYADQQFLTGADTVICGHFHTPYHQKVTGGSEIICLGDWIQDFSYLKYAGGTFELKTWSEPLP